MGIKNLFDYLVCKIKREEFWISSHSKLKVLDVGCGEGQRIHRYGSTWCGVDINKEVLAKANEKKIRAYYGNATKLPFKNNEFDVVLSFNLIEHLSPGEAYKHLVESLRVLKINGTILLSSPMARNEFWGTFSHIRPYPPTSLIKISDARYGETFEKLNFVVEDVFYFGYCNIKLPILSQIVFGLTTILSNLGCDFLAGSYIAKLKKM